MSLGRRMRARVGYDPSVGEYLTNKIGHTALITLVLFAFRVPLVTAAIAATALYLCIGKTLWLISARRRALERRSPALFLDETFTRVTLARELKDIVFDTLVSGSVILLALAPERLAYSVAAFVLVVGLFLVLDNNSWGYPS